MSAETLRKAAALMRERAQAATPSADPQPGGWAFAASDGGWAAIYGGPSVNGYRDGVVLEIKNDLDCEECTAPSVADGDHIASWHPAVALAVADWLDGVAARVEAKIARGGGEAAVWSHEIHALAVARAYLGEQP